MKTIKELKENKELIKEVTYEINDKCNTCSKEIVSGYVESFTVNTGQLQETNNKGIPIAIKNNINVKGWDIDCSSNILKGYKSPYNAKVIDKLIENGFRPYGTTNMDEFAMGSTSETSCHGKTVNPINKDYTPGGSSGGSAAVVAAGVAVAALGSDTGGSVRQPAAFCGCVGFKPAYGHVSRHGLIAYSSSLDQIGTLTQNVEDAAILYDSIKGYDEKDSTSLKVELSPIFENLDSAKKYKIAYVKDYIEGCQEELKRDIYSTLEYLKKEGHTIEEINLFNTDLLLSAYYTIATAEASSNLSRFTGIEYGKRSENYSNLEELYINTRTEGFGEEVKKRIMLGSFVLSSGYYEAYYQAAKKVQRYVKKSFEKTFEKYDLLIMPVAPTTALKFDSKLTDLQMYLNDIYTISINIAGLPALALPIGKDDNGLPTSLQIISSTIDEQKIFNTALNIEKSQN